MPAHTPVRLTRSTRSHSAGSSSCSRLKADVAGVVVDDRQPAELPRPRRPPRRAAPRDRPRRRRRPTPPISFATDSAASPSRSSDGHAGALFGHAPARRPPDARAAARHDGPRSLKQTHRRHLPRRPCSSHGGARRTTSGVSSFRISSSWAMLRCSVPSSPCMVARMVGPPTGVDQRVDVEEVPRIGPPGPVEPDGVIEAGVGVRAPRARGSVGGTTAPVMSEKYASRQACIAGSSGSGSRVRNQQRRVDSIRPVRRAARWHRAPGCRRGTAPRNPRSSSGGGTSGAIGSWYSSPSSGTWNEHVMPEGVLALHPAGHLAGAERPPVADPLDHVGRRGAVRVVGRRK